MHFATGAKLFRSRAEILPFFTRPEAEIEYHIDAQRQRSFGNLPLQSLNDAVPCIVLRIARILTEEADLPLIGREAKCRILAFERTRQGCLSGPGKTDYQMKRCHRYCTAALNASFPTIG